MFVGHFGIGFGAKAVAPRVSLGTLFFAAQFVDLLWPTLLLLGVERARHRVGPSRAVPGKATAVSIITYSVTGIGMLLAPDMER